MRSGTTPCGRWPTSPTPAEPCRRAQELRVASAHGAASLRTRASRVHDGPGLYDVLDTPPNNAPDDFVRPNQIFAVSLPFAPLIRNSPLASSWWSIVRANSDAATACAHSRRAIPPIGRATRATRWSRDSACHQGTAWPWLLGPFAEAHYQVSTGSGTALDLLRPLLTHR